MQLDSKSVPQWSCEQRASCLLQKLPRQALMQVLATRFLQTC